MYTDPNLHKQNSENNNAKLSLAIVDPSGAVADMGRFFPVCLLLLCLKGMQAQGETLSDLVLNFFKVNNIGF